MYVNIDGLIQSFVLGDSIACVGFGWLVDDVWACAIAELVMGVDI